MSIVQNKQSNGVRLEGHSLANFAKASRRCIGAINKHVDGQLVDYDVKRAVAECASFLYVRWSTVVVR